MRTGRTRGALNGDSVVVKWGGPEEPPARGRALIAVVGPKKEEGTLRDQLEARIRRWLDECPYFLKSGFAARYAFKIAYGAPYRVDEARRLVVVKALDVWYRNPPKGWKWWISVRDDENDRSLIGQLV